MAPLCATLLSSSLNAMGLMASYGSVREDTLCSTRASLLRSPSGIILLPFATGL